MEGDAEAMGLIANLAQNLGGLGVHVEEKRVGVSYADYLLQPFCEADDRQPVSETQFVQSLVGRRELPLTTVNHDELRKIVRGLGEHSRIAPVHDFLH